jgi:hypothetical protein
MKYNIHVNLRAKASSGDESLGCFEDFMEFREEVEKVKKVCRERMAQPFGKESTMIDSKPKSR